MNIDLSSICFNSSLDAGGGTPSWGTALGQSSPDYKLTYPGSNEILVAMNYKYVPLSNSISCKLGKGGHEYKALESQSAGNKYEIVMASLFDKTFIKLNNEKIPVNKPFGLLVIKENESVHAGRKSLKYSDSIVIGKFKNKDFFDEVFRILGGSNTCWFAYAINVENQDELIFSVVKVSNEKEQYSDSETRKRTWLELIPKNEAYTTTAPAKEDLAQPLPPFTPSQIIYYGVPGCGKSKKVQDITGNVDEYYKTRVVFHPEYTSADFIGQVFPCVGENGHGIDYRFKAGPFTEILRRAYLNSQKRFFLVIEEINRGNAAAIFSDVFQLLDRLKDGKTDSVGGNTYKNGWSQYFVDNADINAYIRKEEVFLNEIDDNNRDEIHLGVEPCFDKDLAGCYKSIKIKDCNGCEINFSVNTAIRLPPNLSIYATMNTSDQNVFTLDNAFQRRFDMEMIPNVLDTSDADSKVQYEAVIGGDAEKSTGVSWGAFRDWINGKISNANTFLSTEDRCLGGWFVTGDSITDKKKFAEKVLKYLWDDAFKHNREIFKLKSLSEIVAKFVETNGSDAFKEIFGEVPEVKDAV